MRRNTRCGRCSRHRRRAAPFPRLWWRAGARASAQRSAEVDPLALARRDAALPLRARRVILARNGRRMFVLPHSLLAMTGPRSCIADTSPHSRGAMRPSCARNFRPLPLRAQGMPGARCARSRVCNDSGNAHALVTGHTGITRHSPRNGFNGFLRDLPGDRAFLSPSPLRSLLPRNLTPASGRQDHTTSPSASALVYAISVQHPARVRDVRALGQTAID